MPVPRISDRVRLNVPWMNDSGFWVISKMSGMTEKETLQTFTCLSVMGVVGIIITIIGAKLFPLV